MRICFLGHFTGGGVDRATFLLANELCCFYDIFILNTEMLKPSYELSQSIHYSCINSTNIIFSNLKVFSFLRKEKIDLVISCEAMTGLNSFLPARLHGCKHIIWEHENYLKTFGLKKIQFIRQFELKHCDAYVLLTKEDESNFKKHFKIGTKLQQIYNIAPLAKTELDYNLKSKTIISAGHFTDIKNFKIIPEIGKIVFKQHPDWQWIIYGQTKGSYFDQVKSLVEEYHLENNILFYGRCNDMDKEYPKASMFVLTSKLEPLGMVLLEAKTYKLPVLSFDVECGPGEIITDNIDGFLIPCFDVNQMAQRIVNLIENNEERLRISNNSKHNLELFANDVISQKWRSLFSAILKSKHAN